MAKKDKEQIKDQNKELHDLRVKQKRLDARIANLKKSAQKENKELGILEEQLKNFKRQNWGKTVLSPIKKQIKIQDNLLDAVIDVQIGAEEQQEQIIEQIKKYQKKEKTLKKLKEKAKILLQKEYQLQEQNKKEEETRKVFRGIVEKLDQQILNNLPKQEKKFEQIEIDVRNIDETIEKSEDMFKDYFKHATTTLKEIVKSSRKDEITVGELKANLAALQEQQKLIQETLPESKIKNDIVEKSMAVQREITNKLSKRNNVFTKVFKTIKDQEGNINALVAAVFYKSPVIGWALSSLSSAKKTSEEMRKKQQEAIQKARQRVAEQQRDELIKVAIPTEKGKGKRKNPIINELESHHDILLKIEKILSTGEDREEVQAKTEKLHREREARGTESAELIGAEAKLEETPKEVSKEEIKKSKVKLSTLGKIFDKLKTIILYVGPGLLTLLSSTVALIIGSVFAVKNALDGYFNAEKYGVTKISGMLSSQLLPILGSIAGLIGGWPGVLAGFVLGEVAQALLPEKWKKYISEGVQNLIDGLHSAYNLIFMGFNRVLAAANVIEDWMDKTNYAIELFILIMKQKIKDAFSFLSKYGPMGIGPAAGIIKSLMKGPSIDEQVNILNQKYNDKALERKKYSLEKQDELLELFSDEEKIMDERTIRSVKKAIQIKQELANLETQYANASLEEKKKLKRALDKKRKEVATLTYDVDRFNPARSSKVIQQTLSGTLPPDPKSFLQQAGETTWPTAQGINERRQRGEIGFPGGPGTSVPQTPSRQPDLLSPFIPKAGETRTPLLPGKQIAGGKFAEKAPQVMSRLQQDLGISKEDAAAIVGNIGHESGGLNPSIVNPSSGAYGWAQWLGSRKKEFFAFAAENKLDPKSDEANYQFLVHELGPKGKESGALKHLANAQGLSNKTVAFERAFERSGANEKMDASRIARAQIAMKAPTPLINTQPPSQVIGNWSNSWNLSSPISSQIQPSPSPSAQKYTSANTANQTNRIQATAPRAGAAASAGRARASGGSSKGSAPNAAATGAGRAAPRGNEYVLQQCLNADWCGVTA